MKLCPECGCTILWRYLNNVQSVNGPNKLTDPDGIRIGDYESERPIACSQCDERFNEDELQENDAPVPKPQIVLDRERLAAIERHIQNSRDCDHGNKEARSIYGTKLVTYDFCPAANKTPPKRGDGSEGSWL